MNSRRFRIISIVCFFSLLLAGASAGCTTRQQTPPPVQPQAEATVAQPVITELQAASKVAATRQHTGDLHCDGNRSR